MSMDQRYHCILKMFKSSLKRKSKQKIRIKILRNLNNRGNGLKKINKDGIFDVYMLLILLSFLSN